MSAKAIEVGYPCALERQIQIIIIIYLLLIIIILKYLGCMETNSYNYLMKLLFEK
jgi:hypothetical protein